MRKIDHLIPTSFAEAETALAGRTNKTLAANTRLVATTHGLAVRLHNTDIVTFEQDGAIVLHSGSWRTVTTKARMNAALAGIGATVSAKKGEWFVTLHGHSTHRFFDGYTITPAVRVTAGPSREPGSGRFR